MTLKKFGPSYFVATLAYSQKSSLSKDGMKCHPVSSRKVQHSKEFATAFSCITPHFTQFQAIEVERMSNCFFLLASHYNAMGWNYLLKISFTTIRGISAPKILIAPQDGSMLKIRMHLKKEFVCIVLKCTKVFTRFFFTFLLTSRTPKSCLQFSHLELKTA